MLSNESKPLTGKLSNASEYYSLAEFCEQGCEVSAEQISKRTAAAHQGEKQTGTKGISEIGCAKRSINETLRAACQILNLSSVAKFPKL